MPEVHEAGTIIICPNPTCTGRSNHFGTRGMEKRTCTFYLKRKKRNCRMQAVPWSKYCGEHLVLEDDSVCKQYPLFAIQSVYTMIISGVSY